MRFKIVIMCFLCMNWSVLAQGVTYLFTNANVVDVVHGKVVPNQSIAITDGKIVEIASETSRSGDKIIDAKGAFVMPTLGDAHVHFPETEEQLEKMLKLNLINGVTKVRSMRGVWKHAEFVEKFNTATSYYPKMYLTAPPIHKAYDLTDEQFDNYLQNAKEYKMHQIKILNIKNQEQFQKLSDKCKQYDILLGGHFPIASEGLIDDETLFNSPYSSIEHLGGLIGENDKYADRMAYIKNKKVFICPTLQWYAVAYGQYGIEEMLGQRGMEYMDSETKRKWIEATNKYRAELGNEKFEEEVKKYAVEMEERFKVLKDLDAMGAFLLLSPDSSSRFVVPGFGVLEEMKLYQKAGLSNSSILKAATLGMAELFNENYGTIEVGKDADFMMIKENPLENLNALENIEAVFYNQTYFDKQQLEVLAQAIILD